MLDLVPAKREGLRILLSDRDALVRGQIRRPLENQGFRTFEAESSRQAVRIAGREKPHVLVMDLEMPDFPGLEAYHIIKAVSHFVPCIFTGSHINQRIRSSALADGAFSLIPKPLDQTVFRDIFRRLIRKYYDIDL